MVFADRLHYIRAEDDRRKQMKMVVGAAMLGALALWSARASAEAPINVASVASGSDFFSVSAPAAFKAGDEEELTGRVCRLRRSSLLSPSEVRIEHLSLAGNVTGEADAAAPQIGRSDDQRCGDYSVRVAWTIARGDELRACFERGRPCPTSASTLTVALASR